MPIGAVGYRGYMWVPTTDSGDWKLLPYLSEDITAKPGTIITDLIMGGGTGNSEGVFASRINAATGQVIYDGTVSSNVFGSNGNFGQAFRGLLSRALFSADPVALVISGTDNTARATGFGNASYLIVNPGGGLEFRYPSSGGSSDDKCVVESFTLRGNLGGAVEFDCAVQSTSRLRFAEPNLENVPDTSDLDLESISPQQIAGRYDEGDLPTDNNQDDANPLPYYRSVFTLGGITGNIGESFDINNTITAWTVTITNSPNRIFAFNGKNFAVDIVQGLCVANGSFTYYSPTGVFADELKHGASFSTFVGGSTPSYYVRSEYMLLNNPTIPAPGLNDVVTRTVNFECLVGTFNGQGGGSSTFRPSIYIDQDAVIVS